MTDEQLLQRDDFAEIVNRYRAMMQRVGQHYGLDAARAEDVVQDAFVLLYERREVLRERVKQFLVTAVCRSAARYKRAA